MTKPQALLLAGLRRPETLATLPAFELDLAIRYARRSRLLGRLAVDTERLGVLTAPWLVVYGAGVTGPTALSEVKKTQLWASLPAVRAKGDLTSQ